MRITDELGMYVRLGWKLPRFLRGRDTIEQGRERLRRDLANRDANFLTTAERCIYRHPASPYLPLLRHAGCELDDLRELIAAEGLEGALRRLQEAGVYVRFEESKGREPIVRGSLRYEVGTGDFDNPRGAKHIEGATSGSTGPRSRMPFDLDYIAYQSPILMLIQNAQGLHGVPRAGVRGPLPESPGFGGSLRGARQGWLPERWFAPVLDPPRRPELRFRLAHDYVMTVARLCGVPMPRPEPIRMNEVVTIARWACDAILRAGACVIDCTPSMALRVVEAARAADIDLAGAVFRTNGEAMTAAKRESIERSGARVVIDYQISGMAGVGYGCLAPVDANDQHLLTHHLAVIQAPRAVGSTMVDALLYTSLLPNAPRISLNVESDDYGTLEERRCGCPLDSLGLHTHVRGVRSFKKLTAEGVTLVGSDMERVIESVLPSRFGGSALDYQLAEEEDGQGYTRIVIRASPRLQIADEADVVRAVLEGLRAASISADLAGRLWNQAGAIVVRREEPRLGSGGKLMPLHLR
jgi:hypothetical protein